MVKRVLLVLIFLMATGLSCSNRGLDRGPVSGDLKCTPMTVSIIPGGHPRVVQSTANWAILLRGCAIRGWEVNYVGGIAVSISFDRCCMR